MKHFIFLADAWGSSFGGINTLNFELANALADNDNAQVTCIVPFINANNQSHRQVKIIGLYEEPTNKFLEGWELLVTEKISEHEKSFDYIVGHDVVTGSHALKLKTRLGGKVIIINHHSYEHYHSEKENRPGETSPRAKAQRDLFSKADVLVCVGPMLYNIFREKHELSDLRNNGKILKLIPGLLSTDPTRADISEFNMMTMGRMGDKTADLKGMNLTIDAFGLAVKESTHNFKNPKITVYGLEQENEKSNKQKEEIQEKLKSTAGAFIAVNASPYTLNREDILSSIKNSSCVSMLSIHEGFGLVGWETISCQVPLITSIKSGLYETLEEKQLDHLVYSVDVQTNDSDPERVKEILKEIAHDQKKAKQKAENLRKSLLQEFSWNLVIKGFLKELHHAFEPQKSKSNILFKGINDYHYLVQNKSSKTINNSAKYLKSKKYDVDVYPSYDSAIQLRSFFDFKNSENIGVGIDPENIFLELNGEFEVNQSFFDASLPTEGTNFDKLALSYIYPKNLSDATEKYIRLYVKKLKYYDVKNSLKEIEKRVKERHKYMNIKDTSKHRIQHFLCLHFIIRFKDNSVLCMLRSDEVDFEKNKWSFSGEEQLRFNENDSSYPESCQNWFNRAILEEFFPTKEKHVRENWGEKILEYVELKKVLSVIAEEKYGGFALVGLIQLNMTPTEYFQLVEKIQTEHPEATRDDEGSIHFISHGQLLNLLERGYIDDVKQIFGNGTSSINSNELHSTSWYRIMAYVNYCNRTTGI